MVHALAPSCAAGCEPDAFGQHSAVVSVSVWLAVAGCGRGVGVGQQERARRDCAVGWRRAGASVQWLRLRATRVPPWGPPPRGCYARGNGPRGYAQERRDRPR